VKDTALRVSGLDVSYGVVAAVRGLSLEVGASEIVGLIGPNGAGKSTTLHAIMGLVPARQGEIVLDGVGIRGKPPEAIARAGVALVPEGRRLFGELTVRENLQLGLAGRRRDDTNGGEFDHVHELFPILRDFARRPAGSLSGGQQQQLAIARALVARPSVLLLDEPSLGLAPRIVAQLFELVQSLVVDQELTVLLVEQNARSALSIAHRGVVLSLGRVVVDERADVLAGDDQLRHAYLGF
jgi:branched-chain amino acid transport system ATP-binding protein